MKSKQNAKESTNLQLIKDVEERSDMSDHREEEEEEDQAMDIDHSVIRSSVDNQNEAEWDRVLRDSQQLYAQSQASLEAEAQEEVEADIESRMTDSDDHLRLIQTITTNSKKSESDKSKSDLPKLKIK